MNTNKAQITNIDIQKELLEEAKDRVEREIEKK